jgi:hypothetical protein
MGANGWCTGESHKVVQIVAFQTNLNNDMKCKNLMYLAMGWILEHGSHQFLSKFKGSYFLILI